MLVDTLHVVDMNIMTHINKDYNLVAYLWYLLDLKFAQGTITPLL